MNQILRSMSVMVGEFRRPFFSPCAVISPSVKYFAGEWHEAHETSPCAERRLSKKRSCPSEMVSPNAALLENATKMKKKYFKHAPDAFCGCILMLTIYFKWGLDEVTNSVADNGY